MHDQLGYDERGVKENYQNIWKLKIQLFSSMLDVFLQTSNDEPNMPILQNTMREPVLMTEVDLSIKPNTGMCMALHVLPVGVSYFIRACFLRIWTVCSDWCRYACRWLSWGYILEETICLFCPDITSANNTSKAFIVWKTALNYFWNTVFMFLFLPTE